MKLFKTSLHHMLALFYTNRVTNYETLQHKYSKVGLINARINYMDF
jgi:hypothetical protein